LEEYRADFGRASNRSMSMPIAGLLAWTCVGVLGCFLAYKLSLVALFICTGMIFPVSVGIGKMRGEEVLPSKNPLAKLMGLSAMMVNLLWAVHIPLFLYAPQFVPLSLGISVGIHWVIYSWIIQHSLGIIHAVARTVLILAAWSFFEEQRLLAVSVVVVFMYIFTLYKMGSRTIAST